MSVEPMVLLTFERRNIIVAKQFGYIDGGGIVGIAAVCEDGSRRLFAVKSDPTNAEFYKIKVTANASQDDQRRAVEAATRWSEDEFPWVETDDKGNVIEGTDTHQATTTANLQLNEILAHKNLPFVFIDDDGPEDWH